MSRRRRLVDPPSKPPPAPVVVVESDIVQEALRLAEGDRRRIVVQSDGSVLVINHPR